MRQVQLKFGPGSTLLVASVLSGACGGSIEGASVVPSGLGGVTGGIGGASVAAGGIGAHSATVAAGGAYNAGATGTSGMAGGTMVGTTPPTLVSSGECYVPPTPLAWTSCDPGQGQAPNGYPFPLSSGLPQTNMGICSQVFTVPVAPEGTPPTAALICGSQASPVDSGWSARVSLKPGASGNQYVGGIALAPALGGEKIQSVALTVLESDPAIRITVDKPIRAGNGYTFGVILEGLQRATAPHSRLTFEVSLALDCGGSTREARSISTLYYCADSVTGFNGAWISSGDACGECAVICEMVASPIAPPQSKQGEQLEQVVRSQVARIGQFGDALLLQAQHDGGAERFIYRWDLSGGTILWQEDDLMLWAPPLGYGEHLLQVSMVADDAAAVSSCRVRTRVLERG